MGREDRKDKAVLDHLCDLAAGILDIYRESEDSAEFDSDCLKEVITLAGMRHPLVYRRLLEQLISDIDNDNLLQPEKLKGLASVLLHVTSHRDGVERTEDKDAYCKGDDLKVCLSLVARKFDTLLLSDDNENVHHILDTMNIVLTLMAAMKLTCRGKLPSCLALSIPKAIFLPMLKARLCFCVFCLQTKATFFKLILGAFLERVVSY